MCTYSLVPITLAPAQLLTCQEPVMESRVQLVACLLIPYYYPKCALLHARLKKLYFFQIVKEQNNSDLEKIKQKSQPVPPDDLRLNSCTR